MRATPVLLAIVAVLAVGCASDPPDAGPNLGALADQAERVGQLVEEDRSCEAAQAARTLATLAEQDGLELEVRQAVMSFASSAQASITCDPDVTPSGATPTDSPTGQPEGGHQGGGGHDGGDDDDRGEGDPGEGEGKGDGDDKPGRGRGRDNGNGNGNGDD